MALLLTILRIARLYIGVVILAVLFYCINFSFTNPINPMYPDTGIIKSKASDNHGFYLNVEFEKSGFISLSATRNEYFKHEVGDKVKYDLYSTTSFTYKLTWITGVVSLGVVTIIPFILLVMYLLHGPTFLKKYYETA